VPITFTGDSRASDAGGLHTGRETVTSEPGSAVITDFTNDIFIVLIVDTEVQGATGLETDGRKVRVMGGGKLSSKSSVVPAAFASTVAALRVRYLLVVSTGYERARVEIPQQSCYLVLRSRHVPRLCKYFLKLQTVDSAYTSFPLDQPVIANPLLRSALPTTPLGLFFHPPLS